MTFRKITSVAQGEVNAYRIAGEMPAGLVPMLDRDQQGRPIIGHSESGHHHVLDRPVEVFADPAPPRGMKVFYALLDQPTALVQDAPGKPHETQTLPAGLYQFKIAREFDPFADEVRQVAD